jgi:SAM-dependent methyltransferase
VTEDRRDFSLVTETPGLGATREQLSMLQTRYHLAALGADGKDLLEVACGSGMGLGYLARRARRVVGGDCDPRVLDAAASHYGGRLGLLRLDAHRLPFLAASFDRVLLYEALYYLASASAFVAEARRVLRPAGSLLVCTVNREWSGFNPSPFSVRYYSAPELRALLEGEGFRVEVLGGFAASPRTLRDRIVGAVRSAAVALHLIPKSMKGKQWLKRLFLGKLTEMGPEVTEGMAPVEPLKPWSPEGDTPKVLYAIATRP